MYIVRKKQKFKEKIDWVAANWGLVIQVGVDGWGKIELMLDDDAKAIFDSLTGAQKTMLLDGVLELLDAESRSEIEIIQR